MSKAKPVGRAKLIEAALSCMADLGYQGTTVRKIAGRAEVTQGLVRHHFGNKDGLMVATYRHLNEVAIARIADVLDANRDDIAGALDGTIKALFPDDLSDVRQMRILVAFWGLVPTDPNFAEVQAETNAAFHAHFVRMIETHLGPQPDAEMLADGIIAVADGLWLECCMNPTRMTPNRAIMIATRFSRDLLGLNSGGEE